MDRENLLQEQLKGIRQLLSHLQGEMAALESGTAQVLRVLHSLEGVAQVDELTGLLRRKPFFDRWNRMLKECEGLGQSVGVLLVDIDHFKKINDTYGHLTGDEVLSRVGALLRQYVGDRGVIGRFGGEEFVIALRGSDAECVATGEFIRRGAERLHGAVIGAKGVPDPRVQWRCTLSVGLAASRTQGFCPKALLQAADEALYAAKKRGRNQVRCAA